MDVSLYYMKKLTVFLILFTVYLFAFVGRVKAIDKNIFGLHLTQTGDIDKAHSIINSQGGDWGYITIVIRTDQLNHNNWQEFMDKCRKYHIIPIIRMASIMENGYWKRPSASDIDNLSNFLHSLNWPTEKQHVIFFNEINHGTEWGGEIDIKSYTDLSIYAYQKLHALNPNFVFLSGGLDLAAPNKGSELKTAGDTYREIFLYKPEYFQNIDAIASHSYPNHGYVGLPTDTGQHSIRGYTWEQSFLKSLGVSKTFPVYITETGWPHREGETKNNQFYTAETSTELLRQAIKVWQKDDRVMAITPFIYNYPYEPFDHFTWIDKSENLLPAYQKIVNDPKSKNTPSQKTSYELVANHLPFIILTDTEYLGEIILKNTGQSIWGETSFCLSPESTINVTVDQICTSSTVYPGSKGKFSYKLKIKNIPDYKENTFISWKNIDPQEISPLNGSGTIYSPKTTILQKVIQYFQGLFIL